MKDRIELQESYYKKDGVVYRKLVFPNGWEWIDATPYEDVPYAEMEKSMN